MKFVKINKKIPLVSFSFFCEGFASLFLLVLLLSVVSVMNVVTYATAKAFVLVNIKRANRFKDERLPLLILISYWIIHKLPTSWNISRKEKLNERRL